MTLETALSFFLETYGTYPQKQLISINNPATKRLREGYWGILVCAALDIIERKTHYIYFPTYDDVDLLFLSRHVENRSRPSVSCLEFDVKEYTNNSSNKGFSEFVTSKVIPRFSSYGIIIGLHEDVSCFDPTLFQNKENKRGVFIVSADPQNKKHILSGKVQYFYKQNEPLLINMDLKDLIISKEHRLVFSNKLIKRPI